MKFDKLGFDKPIIMKKFISTFLFLFVAAFSFAQTLSVPGDAAALQRSKKSGIYQFTVSGLQLADVQKHNGTYTRYFTVSEAEKDGQLVIGIKMLNNDSNSRRIIHRYLVTIGVTKVILGGKEITVDELIEKHII